MKIQTNEKANTSGILIPECGQELNDFSVTLEGMSPVSILKKRRRHETRSGWQLFATISYRTDKYTGWFGGGSCNTCVSVGGC